MCISDVTFYGLLTRSCEHPAALVSLAILYGKNRKLIVQIK